MSTTFTRTTQSEDASGVLTPTVTTITGSAVQVRGNPDTLRALSLIESAAPTLFFTPNTYGDKVKEGDTTVWASETYTAKDCYHIAPDGVVIASRVVIIR